MASRIVSLLLLSVFFFGFISEADLADDVEQPAPIEMQASIQAPHQHEFGNQAPFDDCGEGAPCNGHCHFGQCHSILPVIVLRVTILPIVIEFQTFYSLPSLSGPNLRLFRPPIV